MSIVDQQEQILRTERKISASPVCRPQQVNGIRRLLYIAAALLFLTLGVLGIVLPVVPTTPFLLLMSYFLVRSWPSLNDRVVDVPIVGRPLRDWREKQGVERPTKTLAYVMVSPVVTITLFAPDLSAFLKSITVLLALSGSYVVWKLPTV